MARVSPTSRATASTPSRRPSSPRIGVLITSSSSWWPSRANALSISLRTAPPAWIAARSLLRHASASDQLKKS